MARSLTTTDHETIRKWAEERGGKPSEVASTARDGDVGIIRIDFPGFSGEGMLQEISRDDWFRKFDETNLAFVYEEETADGQRSNFNELAGRETAQARAEGVKTNQVRRGADVGGAVLGRTQRRAGRGAEEHVPQEPLATLAHGAGRAAGCGVRATGYGLRLGAVGARADP